VADVQASALLALWNDVDPAFDADYNDWHANEHVPERLTVPGMLWGRRYGLVGAETVMPRYLTLYGLRDAAVLDCEPYLRLLREPTPTSRRMRPLLKNLSRWVCRLDEEVGLDHGNRLTVWTFDAAEDAARGRADLVAAGGGTARGHLLAERLPQASALPWLQAGQTRGVEGQWLLCAAPDAAVAGATTYQRLPCG
jgi:hypothetical protein